MGLISSIVCVNVQERAEASMKRAISALERDNELTRSHAKRRKVLQDDEAKQKQPTQQKQPTLPILQKLAVIKFYMNCEAVDKGAATIEHFAKKGANPAETTIEALENIPVLFHLTSIFRKSMTTENALVVLVLNTNLKHQTSLYP